MTSHRPTAPLPPSPRQRRAAAVSLALLLSASLAAAEADFAVAFSVEPPAGESVFAIELTPDVYATLATDDLVDLAVFDAEGRELAVSLQRPPPPAPQAPERRPLPPPVPLPGETPETSGSVELHLRRDGDGRVSTMDLRTVDGDAGVSTRAEWLVDLGDGARDGVDGLRLAPDGGADVRTRLDVRASDDLVHWDTLQTALPLLRVAAQGQVIERLDLRFPRTTKRYLALQVIEGGAFPAGRWSALRLQAPEPAPPATLVLEPRGVSADGLSVDYGSIGPLPMSELAVRVPAGDEVLAFTLEQAADDQWSTVAAGTAWRLTTGGESLASAPIAVTASGRGALRLRLDQPSTPPTLVVGYRPDRLVVLGGGVPPLRLMAGSARAQGQRAGVDAPLAAIRARRGADWQPPLAVLGPPVTLAGAAALEPAFDAGRWSLWGVLILGAIAVGAMAWRVLRRPAPGSTDPTD